MNKNRKTSHILNVFQFDANGHVILPATLTIGENPHSSDNTSKIPSTSWIRTYVTGLSYLTGNQSITVSGDATGSGTTAITLTLANTAVTPGTYGSTTLVPVVTVDSKGRITSVTTAAISGSLTFTGDVTGSGTTGTSTGLTLAASGVTAGTYTKVTVDSKGRVTVGANASTTDISEGTNLYYTDTRVGTYLTANSYATQSYVGTQIANLVASAPATLDTLNELSVALGNDPNFATSVATSIGTKQAQLNGTGFVKVVGTTVSYDNNTYLTSFTETDPIYVASTWYSTTNNATNWNTAYGWGNHAIVGYLTSVPTHNQAWSTITSTPTTISGYGITNAYTDAQIQNFFNGANAITGYNKSNWDTAYGWGNHASGGYLTGITSSQVTTALGYTPYNSTNPSGYITGITSSNVTTALGYTPYNSTNPSGYTSNTGTVTSVGGTGTVSGLTLTGTVTTSGNLTLGGTLSLTAANVNAVGAITNSTSGTAGSISGFNNPTTAATANTIAYRDASGDIAAREFVLTAATVHTVTPSSIVGIYPTTNQVVKFSASAIQTFLGLGSLAYSSATIPTNNNQLTNGAGYITSSALSSYLPLAGGTLTGALSVSTSSVGMDWWKDGSGTYMEFYGTTTANRKLRLQGSNGSNYAQWFIDAGNQQIYGDVASVRNFLIDSTTAYLRWGGADKLWGGSDGTRNSGWAYHNNNDSGLHWPNNGWHLYPSNASDFRIRSGSSTDSALRFETAGTVRGYVYAENDNTIGFLNNSRGWSFRTYANGNATVYGYLTVNGAGTSSSIYMNDSDEGQREIHCNSNRIGFLTQAGNWGAYCDDAGNWFANNLSGTNTGDQTNISGNAATASSVAWSGVSSGYRENYVLGFRPSDNSSSYAGFQFASPGNDSNAGYFLVRGGADNDVYTQNGLTIVADLGWLTLAQRTTASKGVRIMTGTSSTTRMEISTAGLLSVYGTSYAATQTSFSPSLHIRGSYYGGPRLQVYGLDADPNGWMGLGTDMAAGAYQFSLYYSDVAGSSISFGRFNGGNGTRFSGYTTTALLSYAGTFTAAGDIVAYGSPSDISLKTNIKPLENSLEKIIKLQGVSFTWKEDTDASKLTEIKDDLGFIAQEVQKVLPELVRKNKDNGLLSLRDKGIMPLLVEAIKEQQLQIEELKNKLDGLTR